MHCYTFSIPTTCIHAEGRSRMTLQPPLSPIFQERRVGSDLDRRSETSRTSIFSIPMGMYLFLMRSEWNSLWPGGSLEMCDLILCEDLGAIKTGSSLGRSHTMIGLCSWVVGEGLATLRGRFTGEKGSVDGGSMIRALLSKSRQESFGGPGCPVRIEFDCPFRSTNLTTVDAYRI